MDSQTRSDAEESPAVSRSRVFVLLDGTFVVRWQHNRVQELQTGQYRAYQKRDFGAPITDYELMQLQATGIVETFDDHNVRLCPLPKHYEVRYLTLWEQNRTRSYYLNTTLPASRLDEVTAQLAGGGLQDEFFPRVRDDYVVLWASNGMSFHRFDDAEKARMLLLTRAPKVFDQTVVAFVETSRRA
ncbi:MAG: hypothetical protein ACOCX3_01580 [Chloroflexota bacterium]